MGGALADRPTTLAVTGVYSTRDTLNLEDFLLPPELQTRTENGTWHVAVQFSHLLIESSAAPGNGLGIYGKVGFSDGDVNPIQAFFSGGLAAHGIIPNRPGDSVGLGYFYYNFSDALQSAVAPAARFDDEQGVELFYNLDVTPWFGLTADVQWIDPANGASEDMWIAGLRGTIRF